MPEYLPPGVYVEEIEIGAKPIEGVSTSTVGFVGLAKKGDYNTPTLVTNWGQFVSNFGRYTDNALYLAPAVYGFLANGGGRCYIVRADDAGDDAAYVGTDDGGGRRTGLQTFKEIDEVNIVCIPGITSKTVQQAMISHCESMKDRFCILDPTEDANISAVKQQAEQSVVSTKGYAALYYPWIKVAIETLDAEGKVKLIQDFVPPSGYVAGIYARSDTTRGVHKAPTNEKVRGVLAIKLPITKGEQDILNPKGINCIRAFPRRGIMVCGARTTASDPLWKYVNVRRLFLFLEKSIDKGTKWVVFEPNDEPLWAKIRLNVGAFMMRLFRQGAFQGSTPDNAFFVKCDGETTTQADRDLGIVNIVVGFAPLKPAEFVIIKIQQIAGKL